MSKTKKDHNSRMPLGIRMHILAFRTRNKNKKNRIKAKRNK